MRESQTQLHNLVSGGAYPMSLGASCVSAVVGVGVIVFLALVARSPDDFPAEVDAVGRIVRAGAYDGCPQTLLAVPEPEGCMAGEFHVVPGPRQDDGRQYQIVTFETAASNVVRVEAIFAPDGVFYRGDVRDTERLALQRRMAEAFKDSTRR
ncbi:hypothetical protein [Rhizobium leguminosarum]|uniref:hypothetical protein n=1 Tax=Rhizobium leguminosarum TaxID=384 RepID=UPI002E0E120C|nr:hypothetical protein U8Q02_38755 [Rhizobium leguminosarum]